MKKKNIPNFQKRFFFEDWDFHSVNTHTSYMVRFFNLIAIVCVRVMANWLLLLTKNDIIEHYIDNKFSNLGVHHATFPNLKDTRAPSRN